MLVPTALLALQLLVTPEYSVAKGGAFELRAAATVVIAGSSSGGETAIGGVAQPLSGVAEGPGFRLRGGMPPGKPTLDPAAPGPDVFADGFESVL